ncbi:MAG: hypothetical protein KA113_15450 [Syntrophaceae bacterium]|nr:hypothetical protein [Syntrophaceae bacterium]
MGKGGARPGAGRKKKDRSGQAFFDDAESYLLAVVQGRTSPDAVRVQAAKTLIAYQRPKTRAKPVSDPPKKMHDKEAREIQKTADDDFEKRAAAVIKKHRQGK